MRTLDRRSGLNLALALVLAALPFAVLSSRVSAVEACVVDGVDAVQIHDIQGAGHVSPCLGDSVADVLGVITALDVAGKRFWMQDPAPDSDDATSEGILVVVHGPLEAQNGGQPHALAVGDAVRVSGVVDEFAPGHDPKNLATTEIDHLTALRLDPAPATVTPTIIGPGGRVPPTQFVEDSAGGTTLGGAFEPAVDGLDFWESLEGMLVEVDDAVAVGPQFRLSDDDREPETLPVLAANGAGAGERTIRGGILVSDLSPVDDQNPERIFLSSRLLPGDPAFPGINVADHSEVPLTGVIDYSWLRYQLLLRDPASFLSGGLTREKTDLAGTNELTIATFNLENLDARDPDEKFAALAGIIVNNLQSPDLLVVEEMQDNNGPTNDGVVDANETADKLISAIEDAGGPTYDYQDVAPQDDQDGGQPGGNIRQGFLFRTDRGLAFLGGTHGDATTGDDVLPGLALSLNPGRIDPTNPAFKRGESSSASRKPLVGAFTYNGHPLFVIGVHMNSKGPDDQLYGSAQPPVYRSEVQRRLQAQVVRAFVDRILDQDANANVIVLGDFNDYAFSEALQTLADGESETRDLAVLLAELPANEQYSYVFAGNSQALDQMLVTPGLAGALVPDGFDVVHVNAEFADQASDHDPQVARFQLPPVVPESTGTPTAAVPTPESPEAVAEVVAARRLESLPGYRVAELQLDRILLAPGAQFSDETHSGVVALFTVASGQVDVTSTVPVSIVGEPGVAPAQSITVHEGQAFAPPDNSGSSVPYAITNSSASPATLLVTRIVPVVEDRDNDGIYDQDEIETDPDNPDSDGDNLTDGAESASRLDPLNPDTDGDGLNDDRETELAQSFAGLDPTDRDSDDDGLTDGDELNVWRTYPQNADSDGDSLADGSEVTVWHTRPDISDSDGDGLPDGQEIQTLQVSDPNNVDSDGDLLLDPDEAPRGTSLVNKDSDGDGLQDGEEATTFGTDPAKPDSDSDGLPDGLEIQLGTFALYVDSDGDTLRDGQEYALGTNLLNPDSDGDGLNDAAEALRQPATNPNDVDSDHDGLSDPDEAAWNAEPLAPDTDRDGLTDGAEVYHFASNPIDPEDPMPSP